MKCTRKEYTERLRMIFYRGEEISERPEDCIKILADRRRPRGFLDIVHKLARKIFDRKFRKEDFIEKL